MSFRRTPESRPARQSLALSAPAGGYVLIWIPIFIGMTEKERILNPAATEILLNPSGGPPMATHLSRSILGLVMALLVLVVGGCATRPGSLSLPESHSMPDPPKFVVDTSAEVLEVDAFDLYTKWFRETEAGFRWDCLVLTPDGHVEKFPAAYDPKTKRLWALVPGCWKGGLLVFVGHDGRMFFGKKGYYADYAEKADWRRAILLQPGEEGVKIILANTPAKKAEADRYFQNKLWMEKEVAKSPSLSHEVWKAGWYPYADAVWTVLSRALFITARRGYSKARSGHPGMYEDKTWINVWNLADVFWDIGDLQAIGRVFGLELCNEPWRGHRADATLTRREGARMVREVLAGYILSLKDPKKREEFEKYLLMHFGDGPDTATGRVRVVLPGDSGARVRVVTPPESEATPRVRVVSPPQN